MVKAGDQCYRVPFAGRSELVESNLLDHDGLGLAEAGCSEVCCCGIGLDSGDVVDSRPQSIDQIPCATADIEHTPGSAGTHFVGHPATIEVVVTPRMPTVEPVDA